MTLTLPTTHGLRVAQPRYVDPSIDQRAPVSATATHIERPGGHFAIEASLPPMSAEAARPFISRLLRARKEGLRIPFPVLHAQETGEVGAVAGSGAGGTSLPVDGFTSGLAVKEGWWLSVVDSDGVHHLHNVAADVTLAGGAGTITVWPPLRADLVDGNVVSFDPRIEGLVTSPVEWPAPYQKIVTLAFTLEESA